MRQLLDGICTRISEASNSNATSGAMTKHVLISTALSRHMWLKPSPR